MKAAFDPLPVEVGRGPSGAGVGVARAVEDVGPPTPIDTDDRRAISEALQRGLAALAPPVAVLDHVRSLEREDCVVVATGSPPGVLVSPLERVFRALHAVRLARSLTQALEVPVVPVFWNECDEHDLSAVHPTWFLNENLDVERLGFAGLGHGRWPMSRVVLRDEPHRLRAARERLGQALSRHDGAARALDLLFPRDGETLARAFSRGLTALAGHLGLVVVEPDWLRAPLSQALAARVTSSPLPPGAEVFHVGETGRRALGPGGEGFRYVDEPGSRTAAELAAEIVQEPAQWSAGPVLRPEIEDAVLPVVARVVGRGAPPRPPGGPARVPAVELVLVDPETVLSLELLGVDVAAFLAGRQDLERAEGTRCDLAEDVRALSRRAAEELLGLRDRLAELDRTLLANLKRASLQARAPLERLARKIERVHANQRGRGRRHVRRVRNVLLPRGQPQAEALGPIELVALHGTAWVDAVLDGLDPFPRHPWLVRLEP